MVQSSISKQADKYAEVIVGQIASNFIALHKSIEACDNLQEVRGEYNKAKKQSDFSKFFFDKNIDEYIGYVKNVEEETGHSLCDGYYTIEPLAVGLFGEWGSGKTHQLKLIKQKILYPPKDVEFPETTVIPIFFNAWRFEKEEHIILPLFETLLNTLEKYERSPIDKTKMVAKSTISHVKNMVTSLHHGLNLSSAIQTIKGIATGDVEDLAEASNVLDVEAVKKQAKIKTDNANVGSQTIEELLKPDELRSIYLNIPQWIEKITLFENINFVFLIDDLDRCLPENTLKMLESIKLFLDVPSCAFVLAVDDDVVERGVVHHYRDYLSIYHHKNTEGSQSVMQHELPITGHEYLEKMIQLPIRLPVIDTVNVRSFLEEHSQSWKKYLKKESLLLDIKNTDKEKEPYEQLLDFFESSIPPKPRKIKRTALLFQSKLQLLKGMKIECHNMYLLVAKITLLELFSPKLLRFVQNNGYDSIYNRLVEFKTVHNSLTEFETINQYIRRTKNEKESVRNNISHDVDYYKQKDQQIYTKMMNIIKEHYTSRIQFDLDLVFIKTEEQKDLQKIIEMRVKEKSLVKEQHQIENSEFLEKLFKSDDVQSWKDAFKVDKLFEEGKATLTNEQLNNIMKLGKEKGLYENHKWRDAIVPYITPDQLKEKLYFEMMPTTVTIGEFQEFVKDTEYKSDAQNNDGAYVYNKGNFGLKEDAYWDNTYFDHETDAHPVVCVSWNDAQAYIKWMNEKKDEYIYALPSKAEWELACNLGKDTKWHFGDDEGQLEEYAWYSKNSDKKTHPVGEKQKNELDLYDMHGNVWEWCENWHDKDKDNKVLKGGSWNFDAQGTRTANTDGINPRSSDSDVGFRLHRTLR